MVAFEKWLVNEYPKALPKGRIGKAIKYTYEIYHRLTRYHLDGRYRIDNNLTENSIRPLALGRLCCAAHNLPYVGNAVMLVVFTDTCPNQERIVFMSTPASSKWEAVECRIVCGLTFFSFIDGIIVEAFSAYLVTIA